MADLLSDPDAVLDYIRLEAQAGAEQAKRLREAVWGQGNGAVPPQDMRAQYAMAVRVHLMYLHMLRQTVTLEGDPALDEEEEEC